MEVPKRTVLWYVLVTTVRYGSYTSVHYYYGVSVLITVPFYTFRVLVTILAINVS